MFAYLLGGGPECFEKILTYLGPKIASGAF